MSATNGCPCGYTDTTATMHSPEWARGHRDHHIATYPGLDQRSVDVLGELVDHAERVAS